MLSTNHSITTRRSNIHIISVLVTAIAISAISCIQTNRSRSGRQGAGIGPIQAEEQAREQTALEAGIQAYIYGYPLVTMAVTRQIMTNVIVPRETRAPMGQFAHLRTYPDATFKTVVAPNADTLYSSAWLDVSAQPYILHLPDTAGRYYLMPMLDAWTNVFAVPGTRTTGTAPATFAITGPTWQGELPAGVQLLRSPTNMVWIIGRTYSTGTPGDYAAAHAIQDRYSLIPLSAVGRLYTPPPGMVNPNIDMKTPTRDQVDQLDAATFFAALADLMKDNPPDPADTPMLATLASIGIQAGQDFDMNRLDPAVARGLEQAPQAALAAINAHGEDADMTANGWMIPLRTGNYGTDYLQRAYIAAYGLGANRPQDAVYPVARVDARGRPLRGDNRYVLRFDRSQGTQLPPVNGFWSLTMYDTELFFVENPLHRHVLSPRAPLTYNPDGSLELYIQHEPPEQDKQPNWLPAPPGEFVLMLRLYWPKDSVLQGAWILPAIQPR